MKKIVRYFYVPTCPEVWATRKRLEQLFQDREIFHFEAFDLVRDTIKSEWNWFPQEEEVLKVQRGEGDDTVLFGKLFFEGEEIGGFPPSPQKLAEAFQKHGLIWKAEQYRFPYGGKPERERSVDVPGELVIKKLAPEVAYDMCELCARHHPYLDPKAYCAEEWAEPVEKKAKFLSGMLQEETVYGAVAYLGEESAAFIEAYPLPLAAKMGFAVSSLDSAAVMITCLSVRTEFARHGLAGALVKWLEKECSSQGVKSLEVLAFSDKYNWQPRSMYKKWGYSEAKATETGLILQKTL